MEDKKLKVLRVKPSVHAKAKLDALKAEMTLEQYIESLIMKKK